MADFTWTDEGTLYSEQYEDIYYHDGQGLSETEYVFLQGNSVEEKLEKQNLVIGELGFGTGLNFLTTWLAWEKLGVDKRITFVTCEKHPLKKAFFEKAHASFPELADLSQQLREKLPTIDTGFHFLEFEQGKVSLLLMYGDAVDVYKQFEGKIDCWYLDGFAPSKNPEMWSPDLFQQMARHSHAETSLATFTAAGFVRRGLQEVGFEIERVKGFGNKKHMTVGSFNGHVIDNTCTLPWFRIPNSTKAKTVAVIGAGMAGLNMAYYLKRFGLTVTVYDKNSGPATEASGNKWGMMFPLISKKMDRLGTLTKSGCAFSLNQIRDLGIVHKQGLLEFITNDQKKARVYGGLERLPKNYIELLSPEDVKEKFNLDYDYEAAYHHEATTFSPVDYAEALIEQQALNCVYNHELESFEKVDEKWQLSFNGSEPKAEFDLLIMATAFNSAAFEQTSYLPLRKTRGQVVYLTDEQLNSDVETGINYVNYLVKESEQNFVLGATFQVDDDGVDFRVEDTQELVSSFNESFPGLIKEDVNPEGLNGRVCFRAVLKDHFPLVGPVCKVDEYKEAFEAIKHGRPRYQYPEPPQHEGLYLLTGLGARGLSTSAMLANYLARMILDGLSILPETHISAIHPSRFLIRDLKRQH
ncbi:MAG: bifunctional tRNA (5-methylaminomethyl-2-thiouridine)(34)-methyltransferase MnmD/FAD-dependent 5-carboxymethylaminomethyl-2-thiouridine(34) oxidoreductase MnmC [Lentisphaeraceae bacterium]|nr:bifunctional tRNA (5-methylaminomethyl-2-thiouridine)(34)-methyltransferase MnmD/FAD-dependent 5-carboxymethylaminomethyl-2-thiouridine(34) oxidoreductase MnmC [Lentisphaeraceae bacterium]